jgi:hypothetical protein
MCELAAFEESTVPVLKRQHKVLSRKIKQLQAVLAFDSLKMQSLKVKKVDIKRQIVALGGTTSGMVMK